jgi:hypothetical protein
MLVYERLVAVRGGYVLHVGEGTRVPGRLPPCRHWMVFFR